MGPLNHKFDNNASAWSAVQLSIKGKEGQLLSISFSFPFIKISFHLDNNVKIKE